VISVTPGGPSASAGLRTGDMITKIDGEPASDPNQLFALTLTKRAGDTVSITYVRNGRPATTTVILGSQS
jgi:putative serine protease PepD